MTGQRPYVTVGGAIEVRRSPMRVQTPIVVEIDGQRIALTVGQAADLQLQLAAAIIRQRRAD